jgi:CheY-like chemotaxis protein
LWALCSLSSVGRSRGTERHFRETATYLVKNGYGRIGIYANCSSRVDDEPLLRMAAVSFISDAGFEALEAGDAAEAVAILESRADIQLVFTDIHMPQDMDGLKLAALIRDRWPPIEIVLTSGYGEPSSETLPSPDPRQNRSLFIVPVSWNHDCDGLADRFFRRVAEYSFGAPVPARDSAIEALLTIASSLKSTIDASQRSRSSFF